jgi:hypothetical protein
VTSGYRRVALIAGLAYTAVAGVTPSLAITRDEILDRAVLAANRLAAVRSLGRTWEDTPYLVGSLLLWEQLQLRHPGSGGELWRRVAAVTEDGNADIRHGDDAAFAQACLDQVRLLPLDRTAARGRALHATDAALRFAETVIRYDAASGPPLAPWWVHSGYGSRYWQDDVFMVVPWLAMRGSTRAGMPAEEGARNLAYEWIEAYAFDHRKALTDLPDRAVPALFARRAGGLDRFNPPIGGLLLVPATGLWRHDEQGVTASAYWCRGNGWVAAGLARAQDFLDAPYTGGRFQETVSREEIRRLLARMAATLLENRNVYGTWNADMVRRDLFTVPETSGTSLLVFMLARGVNEGWLPADTYAPAVLKAFHTLLVCLDAEGNLHHIQRAGAGPESSAFFVSDDPSVNVSFGLGAFLMAAAEVSRMPANRLATLEGTEAAVVKRHDAVERNGKLAFSVPDLGEVGQAAARGAGVAAISGQAFLAAGYSSANGGEVLVDNGGRGEITIFMESPTHDRLPSDRRLVTVAP